MTIQAIIFDVGGVLWRIEDVTPHRKWEKRLGLSEGQLARIIFDNPVAQRAVVGDATTEEVWNEIENQLALPPDELEVLKVDFCAVGAWDTELLTFIHSLKPRYKTGIVSDAWSDARETLKKYVNSDFFDVIVFSAEEGVCKPNPEIYQRALSRLGVAPQEAIFTDDMLPNVEGARQIGMHAIHFTDSRRLREEIKRLIQA
jgi:putative hydrolase of the HAD superfamily